MRDLGGLQKVTHYERQVLQTNAGDKNWSRFHSPADGDYVRCRKRLHHLEVVGCSKLSTIQPASGAFRFFVHYPIYQSGARLFLF